MRSFLFSNTETVHNKPNIPPVTHPIVNVGLSITTNAFLQGSENIVSSEKKYVAVSSFLNSLSRYKSSNLIARCIL